jgi:phage terminase small subunit
VTTHAPTEPLKNARWEAFCAAYVRLGELTAAAVEANYSPRNAKYQGARLHAMPVIQARIAALQRPAAEAATLTLQSHLEELKDIRDRAKRAGDFSPAVKAEVSRGQVIGLYTKRVRVQLDDPKAMLEHLKALPLAERKAFVVKLLTGDAA